MNPIPRWTFRLPKERRVGARRPAVANGVAHVMFMYDRGDFVNSTLFALDLASGAERWSRAIEHIGNEPVLADGILYWSSFEGSIRALDPDGRTRWESAHANASIGVPVLGDGGRLFVSEIAGGAADTWCLDRATGRLLWRFRHGGHTYRLCYADGRLYHTSVSGGEPAAPLRSALYSLDAADGRVTWSAPDRDYLFNPIVLEGQLYVCSSRRLFVLDAARGRRLAEIELGKTNATHVLAPASLPDQPVTWEDNVGQGSDVVTAFSTRTVKRFFGGKGRELIRAWRVEEPRRLCEAPVTLSGDRLIYLTHDGTLCTLAHATGERLSEVPLKSGPSEFGGIAVSDAGLLVAHGRTAFAFDDR
jgi:outer membrane protein assembly factor BamB